MEEEEEVLESTSTAVAMGHWGLRSCVTLPRQLPDDLITQIQLRLPVDSVFRFMSVCKSWNHSLSAPSFRRDYLRRRRSSSSISSSSSALLLGFFHFKRKSMGRYPVQEVDDGIRPPPPVLTFLPTCRQGEPLASREFVVLGLIGSFQCWSSSAGLILCGDYPRYHVCNPITNQWFSLPQPDINIYEHNNNNNNINYHDDRQVRRYSGAGFSCHNDDHDYDDDDGGRTRSLVQQSYTVVVPHFIERHFGKKVGIDTYSSKTGLWRESTLTSCAMIEIRPGLICTSVEGVFYWFSRRVIVAYDPNNADDFLWMIRFPPLSFTRRMPTMWHSPEGLLQCAVDRCGDQDQDQDPPGFSIYVLRRKLPCYSYSEVIPVTEWDLRYVVKIDLPGMVWDFGGGPSEQEFYVIRMAFHPLNPAILYFRMGSRIFSCDVQSGRLNLIPHEGLLYFSHARFTAIPYFQPEWPSSPLP